MILTVLLLIAVASLLYIIYGAVVAVALIHLKVYQGNSATEILNTEPIPDVGFVFIPSAIGEIPAVQSEAEPTDTWLLIAHGLSGDIQETEHFIKLAHSLNMTALSYSYRNHAGAPITDGWSTFGRTEVEDVEAVVDYAKRYGAQNIILAGMSHGGAISLAAAYQSRIKDDIRAVILQSPALNLRVIIRELIRNRLPIFGPQIAIIAMAWLRVRERANWKITNYIRRADELAVPALVLHGTSDDSVPFSLSQKFSQKRPELIQLEAFKDAEHIEEHVAEPERFANVVKDFVNSRS